jgi:SOS-response transcriptional repressor LexA
MMSLTTPHGVVRSLRPPTSRQYAVLKFIHEHLRIHATPPTLREIGRHMGISSTNGVNDHIVALERKGLVIRQELQARTVRLTVEGLRALGEIPSYVPPTRGCCGECGRPL